VLYVSTNILRSCEMVFDASCSMNNKLSLNQCLDTDPSLNPELFDILFAFLAISHCLGS